MPEDYNKAVLAAYNKKKIDGGLSPNLLDPSPGNIREECLVIYRERHSVKDDEIIKLFFSDIDKEKGYFNILQNSRAEKFKQMPKIMKGDVDQPGIKYVELLAWLIDFNPRPSTSYYMSFYKENEGKKKLSSSLNDTKDSTEEDIITRIKNDFQEGGNRSSGGYGSTEKVGENTTTTIQTVKPPLEKVKEKLPRNRSFKWTPAKIKSATIAFVLLVAASLGTYFSIPNETSRIVNPILTGKEQCMYWTGERYRPILCNQKIENTPVIALDPQQLSGLKKITQPDTLTKNSINKVGYAKLGRKEIEFYTTTGNHPTIYNKRILPMTAYILNKYIVHK